MLYACPSVCVQETLCLANTPGAHGLGNYDGEALRRAQHAADHIGQLKEHHRMGRNHLAHARGDAINAVLAAAGYNFRRLLAWVRLWLLRILIAFSLTTQLKSV